MKILLLQCWQNFRVIQGSSQVDEAITDLQTQKVYLFDSQAKLISNFPVYGNSLIELDNIDVDSNLEFVVKGDSNNIIVYKIN